MPRDVTSIEIKASTWKELNALKEPGDSFDDVIQGLLHGDREDGPDENENTEEVADGGFRARCSCGDVLTTTEEVHAHLLEDHELANSY